MDAEHYRRKARHYLMCAHETKDLIARAALINLAMHWEQMAGANEHAAQDQKAQQPQQVRAPYAGDRIAIPVPIVWPGA
jgi:hypothetical protein